MSYLRERCEYFLVRIRFEQCSVLPSITYLRGPSPAFRVWQRSFDVSMVRHRIRATRYIDYSALTRFVVRRENLHGPICDHK